jgi:hypothetical protein
MWINGSNNWTTWIMNYAYPPENIRMWKRIKLYICMYTHTHTHTHTHIHIRCVECEWITAGQQFASQLAKWKYYLLSSGQTDSGVHPASYWMEEWGHVLGVKGLGCESHHLHSLVLKLRSTFMILHMLSRSLSKLYTNNRRSIFSQR